MSYPMWNQSRTGILVDRGNGVLAFVESGPEFESLKGVSADWHQIQEPPKLYTAADFEAAIQRHIDATARQRLYRDGNTCASYVNSTVALWAAEASAFVAWRDAVWTQAFGDMAQGEFSGSPAEYVATLPAIEWPE